jgi:superfamily II DNA or RNA helicase
MDTTAIAPSGISLYDYQEQDVDAIFERLKHTTPGYKLLYQLPTGGGKTVVFSEIIRRFAEEFGRKVLVLTHRNELSRQTTSTLKRSGIPNKLINSSLQRIPLSNPYKCYVALVETLKNRIRDGKFFTGDIGLVIIDEAHNNSFRKLLSSFETAYVIGVTATPFSSDKDRPLNKTYSELITGEPIGELIRNGFLARAKTYTHRVELDSLKTGIHGDYTVSSSDLLYGSPAMQELLLAMYRKHAEGKKTLIFNNGIATSRLVMELFESNGYAVRHLDNRTPAAERAEILKWFKRTKNAVLTSVSILTTGFDEPTVQSVILNRATTSIALYFQMIGRGSRILPRKKTFTVIDLGNNTERFGKWEAPVDWQLVFERPDTFADSFSTASATTTSSSMTPELRAKFPNTLETGFDFEQAFREADAQGKKHKTIINAAVRQHVLMCMENADAFEETLELVEALEPEIIYRATVYSKMIEKATKNYKEWLIDDYKKRLTTMLRKLYARR